MLSISGTSNGLAKAEQPCSSCRGRSQDVEQLEAIVEGASEGLVLVSSDGLVLRANRAAAELMGYDLERVIGQPIRNLLFTSNASLVDEILATNLAVSRTCVLADGRSILVVGRPIATGSPVVVLALRDVSSMKQLVSRAQGAAHLAKSTWAELRHTRSKESEGPSVVAGSVVMQNLRDKALQFAAVDSPVLLYGETGTGKGVFAKLIHEESARHSGPYYAVNCGAIPEGLLEAELFGYAKGAFTGADPRGKVGLIELAHTGSLLLDEVGDMPLGLQVKLLHFLESGEVWPVGASKGKRQDVRIIAATNRDLGRMIGDGGFRRDLYYRLHVLTIHIPPLREHSEDIPALVAMMLDQLERKLGTRKRFAPPALDAICRLPLPGNVRELWNLVESLAVTVKTEIIETTDILNHANGMLAASHAALPKCEDGNLREALRKIEAEIVRETLQRCGTQSKAARHLGVAQATIARKSKRYGLGV